MSRVGETQGLLKSLIEVEDWKADLAGLPERYLLPPDGRSIEAHVESLYPYGLSERPLINFARPDEVFLELLRPDVFRQVLSALRQRLSQSDEPTFIALSQLLLERADDEKLLRMALHLLHKV
jgi:type III secretion protein X